MRHDQRYIKKQWLQDLNRHLPKVDIQTTHEKILSIDNQRNANQNHSEVYIPLHLSEGLSSKQEIKAGEDMEQREPQFTIGEKVNWFSHCGKQHASSQKSKSRTTIGYCNFSPWYIASPPPPQKMRTLIQKYNMHPNVHSSIVYNAQPKSPSVEEYIKDMYYTHKHIQWNTTQP